MFDFTIKHVKTELEEMTDCDCIVPDQADAIVPDSCRIT